jgi:Icc-related predicted phosphoesterase
MIPCLFASDLHGSAHRTPALLDAVSRYRPRAVFLGGDLLPGSDGDFLEHALVPGFERLRAELGAHYPAVFVILGNDDPRIYEPFVEEAAGRGIWHYVHGRSAPLGPFTVFGYNCVPPTPFRLKDWERYDVSRYVDPGCLPPEEGFHTVALSPHDVVYTTIAGDLERLTAGQDLSRAVCLFHTPPYQTALDRMAQGDRRIDHAPLDPHVGSIAVRRFVETQAPWLGLHGHIHEAARLSGAWKDRIGSTVLLGAAHDGPELAVVRFDLERPDQAERELR